MDLGLKGKVALVCGGSRGMGRAIVFRLAQEGCHLAVVARQSKDLKILANEIKRNFGVSVLAISSDLATVQHVPRTIRKVQNRFGKLHILINNAGGPPPGTFFEVSDADWKRAINQNLQSLIILTREAIPLMKKQNFGRILNIASQVIKEPLPGMILSNTVRSGVVAFAKTISHELASCGITVNTLCPGPIFTDRLKSLIQQKARKEKRTFQSVLREVQNAIPMRRIGSPEEFADMAVFLVSERASYITGTTIAVDGGITKSLL